ncbi:MAG: nodulation protein NfeD [Bryobacterales bacterium]|nr:nodulation protein NfeD [Bryobacterales bacterium]MDE0295418.1 nodulation protein NfeD [Bryobacterales bacterium]
MKSRYLGWLGAVVLLPGLGIIPSQARSAQVIQVDVEHVIHPLTVELVQEAIRQADEEGAAAVLLRLNTPGGLLSAAKDVIQTIVASDVPIIAYVGPSGGRAASAGFMILVSADVAAMAPGTNTGAAHPVLMGGEMDEVMKAKVSNDTAASVRSVTSKRGRNPEVAEKAVLESKSFTESEALDEKLIEYIAPDIKDLLSKLDGKTIKRFDGSEMTLSLADAGVVPFELSYRQSILLALIDPNLAFILFVLGLVGVYVEFSNPGLIVPGVGGAILMILGAMALTVLPINWAAAALVVLGLVFFILEATTTTNGILAAGGVIAMVLGAVMLIDTDMPELSINWGTAIGVTLPLAAITVFLLQLAVRSFRVKVVTGRRGMIGEVGVAKTDVHAKGRVFVHGEWWNASSDSPIRSGAPVQVVGVDDLKLRVKPPSDEAPAAGSPAP